MAAVDDLHSAEGTGPDPVLGEPRRRVVQALLVVLTAVVLPAVMVTLTAVKSPELSRLDEPVHLDYLRRIEQGELPRIGDKVLPESVRDVQCRTIRGSRTAPCGLPLSEYSPDLLGAAGYAYEAQQPPLYYALTAAVRQVLLLGPSDDFVLTARLTGVGWLVLGLLVFWLAARRLQLGWWVSAAVVALMAVSPAVVYQSATVNNDAAAVLTGSVALLLFAHLRERPGARWVALWCGAAVLLVLIKPTGIISVAAASAALLLDAHLDGRLRPRAALSLVAPVIAGLVAYVGWGLVRDARAVVDYDVVLEALLSFKMVDDLPLDDIVATVSRLPLAYAARTAVAPGYVAGPATLVVFALMAAAMAGLWLRRCGSAAQRLGLMAGLALVMGGPAFTALFYIDYSVEGGPHARYGLSLIPLLAAAAAATYRTRRAVVVLVALALLVLAPSLIAILYPTTRA
jgi:hypothetical protein